jgi:hypothetical protein
MVKNALALLALTTGVVLSGSALAEPAKFDGSWRVQMVADSGLLCGSGTTQTLMVQNGSVRAGGSAVSVSGQVGPRGPLASPCSELGSRVPPPAGCRAPRAQAAGRCRHWGARGAGRRSARPSPRS